MGVRYAQPYGAFIGGDTVGYEDFDVEPVDFDDDVEFDELGDEPIEEELELLEQRVHAARLAGA